MTNLFKEALSEFQEMLELDKKTGINNPDIAKGRSFINAAVVALEMAVKNSFCGLRFFHVEKPKQGKFAAFFSDGSGANLFLVTDSGYVSAEGEEHGDEVYENYLSWMPLPDDFEFWFEAVNKLEKGSTNDK